MLKSAIINFCLKIPKLSIIVEYGTAVAEGNCEVKTDWKKNVVALFSNF